MEPQTQVCEAIDDNELCVHSFQFSLAAHVKSIQGQICLSLQTADHRTEFVLRTLRPYVACTSIRKKLDGAEAMAETMVRNRGGGDNSWVLVKEFNLSYHTRDL